MADERIRVGIMGLGRSGWNIHASGISQVERYQIVAVADPVAERRTEAEEKFGCQSYAEPEQLLGDADVELAVVATPSHTHVPLAVAALEAGKHVVVEKPMAQSVSEVDTLQAAAGRAGRVVTAFQNRRFDAAFVTIRKIIDSGRLGEIILIRIAVHRFARRSDWQTLRKYGGGELPNTASHFLDQLLLLMDDGPLELFADLRHSISAGDAEDHVKLCLRAKTGPTVDLESSSAVAASHPGWTIAGTTGGLTSSDGGFLVRWLDPASLGELKLDEGPAADRRYGNADQIDWHEETVSVPPITGHQLTTQYYGKLAETIRDGGELFVTPDSVRRQIDVMERARQQTGFL